MDTLAPATLCTTVGQLQEMLANLDESMPILMDSGVEGVELAVREDGMSRNLMLVVSAS